MSWISPRGCRVHLALWGWNRSFPIYSAVTSCFRSSINATVSFTSFTVRIQKPRAEVEFFFWNVIVLRGKSQSDARWKNRKLPRQLVLCVAVFDLPPETRNCFLQLELSYLRTTSTNSCRWKSPSLAFTRSRKLKALLRGTQREKIAKSLRMQFSVFSYRFMVF